MKSQKPAKVALLATGDEITHGDILNTNAQTIAQLLVEHNIDVGMHVTTSDTQSEIRDGLIFLLKAHDALIITGGLGPTSDDRTRYALSAALRKPLIFDTLSWERIVDRIKTLAKRTPPDSNRQQALFPKDAIIFENPHGTASGCGLYIQGKWVFMLPGPPNECIPMFKNYVLPHLVKAHFPNTMFHHKCLLFDVSEGEIATELDLLVDPYDVSTGFRLCYPYLEFKCHSNNETDFKKVITLVNQRIAKHQLGNGIEPISQTLLDKLKTLAFPMDIHDFATGGLLETVLRTPETTQYVHFHKEKRDNPHLQITISGLKDYWLQNTQQHKTELHIRFEQVDTTDKHITKTVPCYNSKNVKYAVEIICFEIWQYINKR